MSFSLRTRALIQMIVSRLLLFFREPEAVFWTYAFPLIMLAALGLAFRDEKKEKINVDVIGKGASELATTFRADPRFIVTHTLDTSWRTRLQSGKTDVVVDSDHGESQAPEFWFEPRRAESVLARQAVENVFLRAGMGDSAPQFSEKKLEEIGSRYIDFLLPGMIGMNLMGGGMWGIGFVLVDMRVRKLLKRFIATPMEKGDFLLSVMITRMIFTVLDMTFLILFGYFVFGVRCQGSLIQLAIMMFIGASAFSGIGLLTASRAKTIDGISGLMNLIMLPMWLLSGVFFSSERFPYYAQPFIQALPLTCLVNGLRGIMLNGDSLLTQRIPVSILIAYGVVTFTLALRWFRWK